MGCIALQKESVIAVGFKQQADIDTVQAIADMFRLLWNTPEPPAAEFIDENDADDNTGTGNDFATETFAVSRLLNHQLNGFLSAEKLTWATAFCMGGLVSKTGVGPYQYTIVPIVRGTGGCEQPLFSLLSQIRAGAGTLPDDKYRSNAAIGFQVDLTSGAGRAASTISIDIAGIGMRDPDSDSGDAMPAITSEIRLPSASLAFTTLTDDLVTARRVNSASWGFQAPITADRSLFPGSGVDSDGYAFGGRMEFDQRAPLLTFNVDLDETAAELTKKLAKTEGTAVLTQTNGASGYTVTFHRIRYLTVNAVGSGRFLTYDVVCQPLWHTSNGLMTVVADTDVNDILTASV